MSTDIGGGQIVVLSVAEALIVLQLFCDRPTKLNDAQNKLGSKICCELQLPDLFKRDISHG
jgi:hypothetical protein